MKYAALVGGGFVNNNVFDLTSPANRDNCYEPYAALRVKFDQHGIDLRTADLIGDEAVAFELHQNVRRIRRSGLAYLMLFETPVVRPANASTTAYAGYRRIFTWNDDLVDGQRFIKLNAPNPLTIPVVDGFVHRDRFCCLIAANKAVKKCDPRELYSERVRAIRWFEHNAPADFDLYGIDWDLPPSSGGSLGRIKKRLWRYAVPALGLKPFPSYRGRIEHKRQVLQRTRFSICYENVRNFPGYITEKIFDCFFAGCVPVYLGANNIGDHIPSNCFIDRRQFADEASLYAYLKAMDETVYLKFQHNIVTFLQSAAAYPFGSDGFAKTIVSTIEKDLQCNKLDSIVQGN